MCSVVDINPIIWIVKRIVSYHIAIWFSSGKHYSVIIVPESIISENVVAATRLPTCITIIEGIVDYLSYPILFRWTLKDTITCIWTIPECIVYNYCIWRRTCEIDTIIIYIKYTILNIKILRIVNIYAKFFIRCLTTKFNIFNRDIIRGVHKDTLFGW